ncbi:DUF4935 domain-containing protein [Nitratireductor aquimarinus]|uniref:PIN domain-containing protein n=1 Tax=Nitratireductor aquimarinus TaxID=889300 RepID=UPI003B5BB4F9
MAKSPAKDNWLVFVDTNILLDFYRLGGESADRQLKALEKHKNSIITSDQIRMEYLKNRQIVIIDSIKQFTKPNRLSVPPIIATSRPAKILKKNLSEAISKHDEIKKKVERILKDPIHHDPVFQSLNRIFNFSSPLNLRRPDKRRYDIRSLARKRFSLGYPPRKTSDTSIGDAVNWEWIVRCAQESDENHNILIVSRDGDYGITYNNESILNDWLRHEFKSRVSRKRNIELTNKLTTALRRLDEAVRPEDVEEEESVIRQATESTRKWRSYLKGDSSDDRAALNALEGQLMKLFEPTRLPRPNNDSD